MSNRAVGLTWERSLAKGGDLLVLLAIADGCDDEGRYFWGSNPRLAFKVRMTGRAVRYIQSRLLRGGELVAEVNLELVVPRGSKGYVPERFLHVRCVADWPAYRAEKISALTVRNAEAEGRKRLPPTPAKISARGGKITSRARKNPVAGEEKSRTGILTDHVVDLSEDLLVGTSAAAVGGRDTTARELPTQKQVEKLVHILLDLDGPFTDLAELTDAVKDACARAEFRYDSGIVARGVDSALVQRGFAPGKGLERLRRSWL